MSNPNTINMHQPQDNVSPHKLVEIKKPIVRLDEVPEDLLVEKQVSSISNTDSLVKDVWISNFFTTMDTISTLIDEYNYVAMDTEFPGTVYIP